MRKQAPKPAQARLWSPRRSLEAIGDPTLGQVIGGEFDEHFVAHENADAVLAHLAGRVTQNLVIIFQFDAKHRVGQQFDHLAAHFQKFFFRHQSSYWLEFEGCAPITAICSNWKQSVTGVIRRGAACARSASRPFRSEEHTSEFQSLMRTSYDFFCLKK